MTVEISCPTVGLLAAGLLLSPMGPLAAQYVPPNPGSCGSGFIWSAGVCAPSSGGGNAYVPPRAGSCATGFIYSAKVCVPREGRATNAYSPPNPGSCATGYVYSARMCVPR